MQQPFEMSKQIPGGFCIATYYILTSYHILHRTGVLMKVSPQDITPEVVQTALREMLCEVPTLRQQLLGRRVFDLLKSPECLQYIGDMTNYVLDNTKSCYGEDSVCFCQIDSIFSLAFVCGVKAANAIGDVKELEKWIK
jgi:hypothetical protein